MSWQNVPYNIRVSNNLSDIDILSLQLSLFFDIMLAMCSDVEQDAFVSGTRGGPYGSAAMAAGDNDVSQTMMQARTLIWKKLTGITIKACK